ncbi:MAG: Ldh family oxidoreductase [Planctomycetes bacterium]|nr:Ldh family oxidoreductase [Planctomycetota bacterium]
MSTASSASAPAIPATSAIVTAQALERFCVDALTRAGVGATDALTTARVMVTTDTWGVFTHGVKCLKGYVWRLRGGGLDPVGRPTVEREGPAWAVMDGRSSLGMVTSVAAMERAIAKARTCGLAYVGVHNTCHFGAAGYYAAMAAERGMIGLAMANDAPSMAVPGAKGRVLGNNPFAFAVPCGTSYALLDIALSTVAGGKVMAAHFLGKSIPADWSLDREGNPTTDPKEFIAGGALTPMAAHKGYGFGILVESLAAALTGAAMASGVESWLVHDPTKPTGHGAAFIALDIASMMPIGRFEERMAALATEIRSAPKVAGCDRIYLPGEIELERRERALRAGIVLPADVVASMRALAAELSMDISGLFA